MREGDGTLVNDTVRQIYDRLDREGIIGRQLTPTEIAHYRKHSFIAGLEFCVQFSDQARRLRLLVPRDAPWACSRVALVDQQFMKWPHVERDGVLCLRRNTWALNPTRPGEAALEELAAAVVLIERQLADSGEADFRDEFRSYWDLTCNDGLNPIYSILQAKPPSRPVLIWHGRTFSIVGDSEESIRHWLRSRFPGILDRELVMKRGGFIWLQSPPIPAEFPSSVRRLREIAGRNGANLNTVLERIQPEEGADVQVILGAKAVTGTGLIGVSISRQDSKYFRRPVYKGFRSGKMPQAIQTARALDGRVTPRTVERADAQWIHGRDQDQRIATLQKARVAVLGCGSVGGHVAGLLAAAGVGQFLLIDPEVLTWANTGRHILGAEFVGKGKAASLAESIRKRLPHLKSVAVEPTSWQQVMQTSGHLLSDCELIISTIGDWSSECQLNAWHMEKETAVPILYGWTEAYGCGGHAVLVSPRSSCLQCGFSNDGIPSLQVGHWPNGSTIRQEPACGADFQPYGPVELMHVCAMIAELAIESLLETQTRSVHRIWAGSQELLESTGGQWTQAWRDLAQNDNPERRQLKRDWRRSTTCVTCGERSNA